MSIKVGQFFPTKFMANDDFSEPPRRTDSKNPIFIFCRFLGPGHLRGPGVSLGRILGVPSIEPFGGGVGPEGSIDPPSPPPRKRKPSLPSSTRINSRFGGFSFERLMPCDCDHDIIESVDQHEPKRHFLFVRIESRGPPV